jgi:peptidoglycan-associated lipoprotein
MRFKKKLVVPVFFLFVLSQAFCQPLNRPSRAMNIAAAETALENKNYYGAIDFLREAYNEEKDDELYRKMAFCYYKIRDYNRSRLYYNRLLRKMPEGKYEMYYEWGRMNKMLGNYEEARKAFRPALNAPGDSLKWLTEQELKGIVLAEGLREDPKFKVYNAGDIVNKRFGELSPVIHTDSTLYFSEIDANRPIEIKQSRSPEKAKIMAVQLGLPVNQLQKEMLESQINEGNFNIGGISFSPDGNFMYYQRVDLQNSEVRSTRLFVSKRNDEGQWTAGRELRLPADWTMLYPSFGVYGGNSVIFFAAEIAGGYGGLDLYYAQLGRNDI